ncbi:helix-turn-helix domain-containing protein [Microbacterium sp. SS28]|uniref:winged helix-turn-helix transcriptional regulator n=1 Tax=Microbacterium sp. SS28 TaxID=2919948 RepID=UPI001FAA66AD|nr:helix-turn-helix domain-containing protein [Microbacterium sp. SS28]
MSPETAPRVAPPMDVLDPDCPSRIVFARIGERWTMFVILALAGDTPLRFTELKARVGVVTAKVLTETLRALETDGLISREAFRESPPRVEYTLTPLGRSLLEAIQTMRDWAQQHVPELVAARRRAALAD